MTIILGKRKNIRMKTGIIGIRAMNFRSYPARWWRQGAAARTWVHRDDSYYGNVYIGS